MLKTLLVLLIACDHAAVTPAPDAIAYPSCSAVGCPGPTFCRPVDGLCNCRGTVCDPFTHDAGL